MNLYERRNRLPLNTIDDRFFNFLFHIREEELVRCGDCTFCKQGVYAAAKWVEDSTPDSRIVLTSETAVDQLLSLEYEAECSDELSAYEVYRYVGVITLYANLSDDVLAAIREQNQCWVWREYVYHRNSVFDWSLE